MRTSNYRKFKITKKQAKLVGGAAAVAVLAGIIFFFAFFHVSKVEVMESNHYTKEELKEMVLTGAFSSNSVLAPITCSKNNVQGVPYIEGYSVSRSGRNSIVISVREKSVVGCIPYLDSYVYFDRNGMFVEGDKTRDESVPYFEGIQVKKVVMNEKLPIKDAVLNTAVALSTIFAKNDLQPDYIQLEDDSTIDLIYGDIMVKLGKDKYLEDKMSRMVAILPQITGEKGILHMENITESSKTVTFEKEEEEVTAENWTGGYDENGEIIKCDYPAKGEEVGRAVVNGDVDYGVLMCGTGIGISIAANKVPGVIAAVCSEPYSAKLTKQHNNANIIAFGARVVGSELAKMITEAWLDAEFEGGRHERRVQMLMDIENR